jgi:hypothetical protein
MKFKFNKFYCTQCGEEGIPIVRKAGQQREAGHLKKLFCLRCQKETNHVECKENTHYTHDDFMIEFLNHNFTSEGNRIQDYNKLKEMIKNEKKENG